ncbi:MAG: DUF5329 domain-containing protein [Gammaproteobacteria bacterium]|nr:DUF5329 domain-containing protein [Gammaproteobacteria bacterium]
MRLLALLVIVLSCSSSLAADVDAKTQAEIAHLFDQMQQSNCQFARNGSWYSAAEAVHHIDKKYQYLLKRTAVRSTENFIERAASRSSISGQPYRVKCGGSAAIESAEWFQAELDVFRKQNESTR